MDNWLLVDFDSIQHSFIGVQKQFLQNVNDIGDKNLFNMLVDLRQKYADYKVKLNSFNGDINLKLALLGLHRSDQKVISSLFKLINNHVVRSVEKASSNFNKPRKNLNNFMSSQHRSDGDDYYERNDHQDDFEIDRNVSTDRAIPAQAININAVSTADSLTGIDFSQTDVVNFNQFETPQENNLNFVIDMKEKNIDSVFEEILRYGNTINLHNNELSNFKYKIELNILLEMDVPHIDINAGGEITINKYVCAGIVAKALFYNNISHLDFTTIKAAALVNNIYKVKLFCILQYLTNICRLINYDYKKFNEDITFQIVNYNDTDLQNNKKIIDFNNVKIKLYDYDENVDTLETYNDGDLLMMYVNHTTGGGFDATDAGVDKKSLQFLEFPELFAVSHYLHGALNESQVLLISNLYKVNNVKSMPSGDIVYIGNEFLAESIVTVDIMATFTNRQKFDRFAADNGGLIVVDENYLRVETSKLIGGFTKFEKYFIKNEEDRNTIFSGSYGEAYASNYTFRFLLECAAVMSLNFNFCYFANDQELYSELTDTLNVLKNISDLTVGDLYKKLTKYQFSTLGANNFIK
ncbi:pagr [Artaxa digramma nucleopolyhedrovirus]|uniref:Pagr n=1 Tax=Artaxa digramma nucleopolyhedrovirus TaxID=3070910 RepID=A0AAE6R7Y8_9ABAC|nr:pagr [Euproctis digramma nucleopolyhedrovirus]QHB21767.1 pagr [Artaxa digramma nucleopolyhedrovirus]